MPVILAPRRALRTTDAARYLGLSASLLRKWRLRCPDDPGDKGPAYIRIGPSLVLYEIIELDRWIESHRGVASKDAA
jgi:hypothetical protein